MRRPIRRRSLRRARRRRARLTDAGRGVRALAVYEPDAARTYWVRIESTDPLTGTLAISRTGFVDGSTCVEDCERLLQLPLPVDPITDGYDCTPWTVMRYWFGRHDLLMFTRNAAREMAAMGYAPFIPEDCSQWDGETPGADTGFPARFARAWEGCRYISLRRRW